MRIIVVFVLLLLNFRSAYSQIPTIESNHAWLNTLANFPDKQTKINFIIDKIKADSIYKSDVKLSTYISTNDHLHDKIEGAPCKIIFTIKQKKVTHFLDLNVFPEYSEILQYLNSETITDIQILEGLSATSLLGIQGNCGVVVLKTNDKRLKKLLKVN